MRTALAAATVSRAISQTPARRVAITIDDGPAVGANQDLARFQSTTSGLISSLVAEKVPATIFINERQLQVAGQRDARAAALSQWLDAGFELGNHTYSHPDLNRVPLLQYLDDIVRGEVVMRALLQQRGQKLVWFRHPFLHTGPTPEVHDALQKFLAERQYRIAPVTVDYADYSFAGAYSRLLRSDKKELADKVRDAYLDQVGAGFEHYEWMSREVVGYEPPQILLIHCNELNSLTLRDSIARMRRRGYSFVTLEEAMKDPVYQRPDTCVGTGGMSWVRRWAIASGKTISSERTLRMPQWISELPRPAR